MESPSNLARTSEATPDVAAQLEALRGSIRELGSLLVCYSGGIDSALVMAIAHEQLGERALAVTAVSASLPASEREGAIQLAASLGARHELVESNEMARPGYVDNGPDRCFHCKSELYDIARRKQRQYGLAHVANGTNVDDLGDYRPGLQAADKAGVRSPLAELGLSKADVRNLARELGLPIWAKPAAACLSSRIPYGTSVTAERLSQIGGFEAALKQLGFEHVRVRWHDTIARIELGADDLPRACTEPLREQIVAAGRAQGFQYVTMDLAGYRQGSHNEVLSGRQLRVVHD